jgi:glycosyltransferase involved in cell wall biosynthesis
VRRNLPFTSAYHTRFPEYVYARCRLPLSISYAWMRWFHAPSRAVMVPTEAVKRELAARGIGKLVDWSRGVDTDVFCPAARDASLVGNTPLPIFLYVGRVAVEKNIEAFLKLDLPGTKWVVGVGPQRATLEAAYPGVSFFGLKTPQQLAAFYQSADVFVFPSLTDTFGLVLLEAMACGTPVAAFPVPGPVDVVPADRGGVLDADLRVACLKAIELSRHTVRQAAMAFSWEAATRQFCDIIQPHAIAGRLTEATESPDRPPLSA